MDTLLSAGAGLAEAARVFFAEGEAGEEVGFQINLFWVIAQALSFLLLLVILYLVAFKRIGATLESRRQAIEQGLRDADEARQERERAADERQAVLAEARREANEILSRAQRVGDETRERELVEVRSEIDRLRSQATAEIQAERQRAVADVRSQVAELAIAAAGRVVGETLSGQRERRLVEEFLVQADATSGRTGRRTEPLPEGPAA